MDESTAMNPIRVRPSSFAIKSNESNNVLANVATIPAIIQLNQQDKPDAIAG
jgi:hypothetical protein